MKTLHFLIFLSLHQVTTGLFENLLTDIHFPSSQQQISRNKRGTPPHIAMKTTKKWVPIDPIVSTNRSSSSNKKIPVAAVKSLAKLNQLPKNVVTANATTTSGTAIARAINKVGTNATAYASIQKNGQALAKSVVVYRYTNSSSAVVGAKATATMKESTKGGRVESGVEVVEGDVMLERNNDDGGGDDENGEEDAQSVKENVDKQFLN